MFHSNGYEEPVESSVELEAIVVSAIDAEQVTVSAPERVEEIPASFYDKEYFTDGTKSNYMPYGPGGWASALARMIATHLGPQSVLDVGCAYGYVVKELRDRGIDASGFDISEYALSQSVAPDKTWLGSAEHASSYRGMRVDLVFSSEMLEHLTPRQIRAFLQHAHIAKRALLLVAIGDPNPEERDKSHITINQMEWWDREFRRAGWEPVDASAFNDEKISQEMSWSGRFVLLESATEDKEGN